MKTFLLFFSAMLILLVMPFSGDALIYNSVQDDGDLIKTAESYDVYIVKIYGGKRFKRLILNPAIFDQYQHLRWENIQLVTKDILDSYTTSNLIRLDGDTRVWQLYPNGDTGSKRLISTAQQFSSLNCDNDAIYTVNIFEYNSYVTDAGTLTNCSSLSSNGSSTSSGGNSSNTGSGDSGLYYYNPSFVAEYHDIPAGSSFPPTDPFPLATANFTRGEKEINFDWGLSSPITGWVVDNFAVRWTKNMYLTQGIYTFSFTGDDGFRVWVGGNLIIDRWYDHPVLTATADYAAQGGNVFVKVEYYDHAGQAVAKLSVNKK